MQAVLEAILRGHGDQIGCVAQDGRSYRYSDLLKISSNAAASARALGAAAGGRLGLMLPDHIATAVITLSLCQETSVFPLNPALTTEELSTLCRDARVDAIVSTRQVARAEAVARAAGIGLLFADLESGTLACSDRCMRPAAKSRSAGLVLLTSGSTGEPKRVPLTPAMLLHSAKTIARTLRLGPGDRAGHLLPMFHIGALVDLVLAPLISGGSFALSTDRSAQGICHVVTHRGATWLQVIPTMLSQCMSELDPALLKAPGHKLRFIRSVSADLSPEKQHDAEALFGTPIIQMYGMTEAAGQIASNPLPPKIRKPGTVGQVDGAEVAILDPTGSVVPRGAEGEICIRGPSVAEGYEDTAPEQHFHAGWLRTGDLGRLDTDGYLTLTGRRKEMINRGGEKISPVEIERAALSVDGVKEAAAFAVPHRSLGEIVGLAIVPQSSAKLASDDIVRALASRLADYKLPRSVSIVPELPRLGSGKIDRMRVRSLTEAPPRTSKPLLRSGVAQTVSDIWQQILGSDPPHAEDDFFDRGGDSLSGTQFVLELEKRTGRRLTGNLLFEAPRFGDLVARLEALPVFSGAAESRAITHVRKNTAAWPGQPHRPGALTLGLGTVGTKIPLFFGSQQDSETRAIRDVIAPDRPLYVMRTLHGLVPRSIAEKCELAEVYAREIDEIQPEGTIFLAGFCEGAELGAMIAERLIGEGREIGMFTSIDYWFTKPTRYPVFHIWSACPTYSPAGMFLAPEKALPLLHPAGFRTIRVRGNHGGAMTRVYLVEAGALLESLIEGKGMFTPGASQNLIPLEQRELMYSAHLKARLPRIFTRDVDRIVSVRVTNRSKRDWPEPESGGPCVTARFVPALDSGKSLFAGFGALPIALKQGQRAQIELRVRPSTAGLMKLEIGVSDDGFSDFGRSSTLARYVWVKERVY